MSAIAAAIRPRGPASRLRLVGTGAAVVSGAAVLGAVAGTMAASGRAWEVIVLVGVFLPAVVWRRPQLGPVVILAAALLIEQFPIGLMKGGTIGVAEDPITNSVPLFHGLGSFHVEPADLLLLSVLAVYLIRSSRDGSRWWPHSHVSLAVRALIVAVIVAEGIGLAHHGDMRESFTELRPFFYLAMTYVLTSVLIRSRSAVQAMLWTIVICETIKSIQAVYLFIVTRPWKPHPQWLLAHEEAMLACLFLFMLIGLWLFGLRGRLRTVSTAVTPLVVFAMLVNERRTAWLILGLGVIVLMVVAYSALPMRRRMIRRVGVVTLLISLVYFPVFWNNEGVFGQPANAVRSEFGTPSPRDALSNAYRVMENANLELNMRMAGPLGMGFGRQIDYAIYMPGLVSGIDPAILYVPHNGVLYILMRLGFIGGVAFWALLGAAIVQGCRLARQTDLQLAMIGAMSAAAVVGWAAEGASDQGFTFFRAVFAIGCVMGLAEAARHIAASEWRKSHLPRKSHLLPSTNATLIHLVASRPPIGLAPQPGSKLTNEPAGEHDAGLTSGMKQ
jgi:hypothetical protein